jgi:hypothetical protein
MSGRREQEGGQDTGNNLDMSYVIKIKYLRV